MKQKADSVLESTGFYLQTAGIKQLDTYRNLEFAFREWFTLLVTRLGQWMTSDLTSRAVRSCVGIHNGGTIPHLTKIIGGCWNLVVFLWNPWTTKLNESDLISDLSPDWKGNISRVMLLDFELIWGPYERFCWHYRHFGWFCWMADNIITIHLSSLITQWSF